MLGEQNLYEQDFYAWTFQQADLLKQGKFEQIDLDNIIEELETLGRSEHRAITSRMEELIMHLLKWQFQPSKKSNSWKISIDKQRVGIVRLCNEMPSLKRYLQDVEWLQECWLYSVKSAVSETGLDKSIFPSEPIWSVEQILDENFYPNDENQ